MPKLCYVPRTFNEDNRRLIATANTILMQYQQNGFPITLRGLYYQFVGKDIIPNNARSYDRLGSLINDARLAGLVDWKHLQDNMRYLEGEPVVTGPAEAMQKMKDKFRLDLWAGQEWRPEVWSEKDAMLGVMEGICKKLRVNFFACRGYTSQTAMWQAGQRMAQYMQEGQRPIIFHFGDHDPSGIDMTRDNRERLAMFAGAPVTVVRLGLNMPEVEQYKLPPNYAKPTDARYKGYRKQYGDDCWEIDAIPPEFIADMIEDAVVKIRDPAKWELALGEEAEDLDKLDRVMEANGWGKQEEETQ